MKDIPISTWVSLAMIIVGMISGYFTLKFTVEYLEKEIGVLSLELNAKVSGYE